MYPFLTSSFFILSSQNPTEFMSMKIERLMRRPPLLNIPRQFWNESLTSAYGGIVVIVLSQFRIFTVVRVTSITSPSAPYFGMVIQSPGRSMSFADSWTPATSPIILSLKISISTAAEAPSPASSLVGSLSIRMATIIIAPMHIARILSIWNAP